MLRSEGMAPNGRRGGSVSNWTSQRMDHSREPAEQRRKPGWKLKNWRLQNEVTQTKAARLFGCSQPVLSQYERGDRDPHDDEVVAAIYRRTGVRWT
jgi:DNA-binding transcriptional regulator YiaG